MFETLYILDWNSEPLEISDVSFGLTQQVTSEDIAQSQEVASNSSHSSTVMEISRQAAIERGLNSRRIKEVIGSFKRQGVNFHKLKSNY